MLSDEFISDLRCPACAATGKGQLSVVAATWLRCGDCERTYPVTDGIPVLLLTAGDRYQGQPAAALPRATES